MRTLLVALDTSTEVTSVGLAWLEDAVIDVLVSALVDAPRAAMSRVLPTVVSLLSAHGLVASDIGQVIVGRGPGSFTGVRIAVASAKGLAHGLGAPLFGVSTLDAVAQAFAGEDVLLGVVGDAMRGEVYPALFRCGGGQATRLAPDTVAKPASVAAEWRDLRAPLLLAGNGLRKYGELFAETLGDSATLAPQESWVPRAEGLFAAYAAALAKSTEGDGDVGALLPVYTRLSDAEENEVARLGQSRDDVPASGVTGGEA